MMYCRLRLLVAQMQATQVRVQNSSFKIQHCSTLFSQAFYLLPLQHLMHINSEGHLFLVCIKQHRIATFCMIVCLFVSTNAQFMMLFYFKLLVVCCCNRLSSCYEVLCTFLCVYNIKKPMDYRWKLAYGYNLAFLHVSVLLMCIALVLYEINKNIFFSIFMSESVIIIQVL